MTATLRALAAPLCLLVLGCAAAAQQAAPPPAEEQEAAREPGEPALPRRGPAPQDDDIVVTATRLPRAPFDVPFSTEVVTGEEIRRRSYRTTPQAFRDIPGIMVQETAHGHGSPYIRGFTSFRNLFLVDGIRLNNSVFRPGPNQYWNTVDLFSLERLEVVKGPSSVLYGSDAVGGTVNAITKSPWTFAEAGLAFGGASRVRYSTAEDSIQARAELSAGYTWDDGGWTGLLVGGSVKSFGDVEGGDEVGTQPETGYDETDLDVKVEHWLDGNTRLVFLHQRAAQDDVPRTHRTVHGITWRGLTSGSDLQRSFDQNRRLSYLQLHEEEIGGPVDALHASLSWHEQSEVRDRIRGSGEQERQGFDVGTLGASVQLESPTPLGRFAYGIEYYRDWVDSFLRRENPRPGDEIQGPVADDATYDLLGVYVQDQLTVVDELELTLGGRYTYAAADADSVRDPVTNTRIGIEDHWDALVGSARFLYGLLPERLNVFGGVSQGFRAPNLSDLTRFDSARTNEFEVPATDLDPEEYLSYEIGVKVDTEELAVQTAYFWTDIEDQILRFPTGNTNAAGESEVTKANIGDGHVWGVELAADWLVLPSTTVYGHGTYMEGRVTNFESAGSTLQETYLTRLMPLTVQVGVLWEDEQSRFWAKTEIVYAGDADKLSFSDERDDSRIPPGGTPGYFVWNIGGGWNITEDTSLDVLLENVTDTDYRVHGSGLNRPGRNLVLGMLTRF